jgi:hypothetical protein
MQEREHNLEKGFSIRMEKGGFLEGETVRGSLSCPMKDFLKMKDLKAVEMSFSLTEKCTSQPDKSLLYETTTWHKNASDVQPLVALCLPEVYKKYQKRVKNLPIPMEIKDQLEKVCNAICCNFSSTERKSGVLNSVFPLALRPP